MHGEGAQGANRLIPLASSVTWFTCASRGPRYQCQTVLILEAESWRLQVTAIAKVFSRVSGTHVDAENFKTIVIFCGVGLVVSLLLATNGLDMSAGFF